MTNRQNAPFLKALRRELTTSTPIWIMRQAGRYLPEYNQTRREAGSFLKLCKTPALACEVTLQPIRRFNFDAAILFSDILTIPDAMGLGLEFRDGEGPVFSKPLREARDILALEPPDLALLDYVFSAVRLIRESLPEATPLIGFAGSPFTLACYMIEGHGSKDFATAKKMLFSRPDLFHHLLNVLVEAVTDYLIAQVNAGADVVQIFDTWGGMLSHRDYPEFSLAPMEKIIANIKRACPDTPVIVFTKGGGLWLPLLVQSGATAIGLDWTMSIQAAFQQFGDRVAFQGNLDPLSLLASPEQFLPRVRALLDEVQVARDYWQGKCALGHLFNLGHGIVPQVPPDHVSALVECVKNYSLIAARH